MTKEQIQKKVITLIAEQVRITEEEVKLASNIVMDLGADSLDQVEIVIFAEEEFEVEISDEEAEKIKTVQDAIDLIARLKGVTA